MKKQEYNPAHVSQYALMTLRLLLAKQNFKRRHPIKYVLMKHPISGKRMWRLELAAWWLRRHGKL